MSLRLDIQQHPVGDLRPEIERTWARGWSHDAREFDESTLQLGAEIADHTGAFVVAISLWVLPTYGNDPRVWRSVGPQSS